MNITEFKLKNGEILKAIVVKKTNGIYQAVVPNGKKLPNGTILKSIDLTESFIEKAIIIRELTEEEVALLYRNDGLVSEKISLERRLNLLKEKITQNEAYFVEQIEKASVGERNEKEQYILYSDLEPLLTESGKSNLFYLTRTNVVRFQGEQEVFTFKDKSGVTRLYSIAELNKISKLLNETLLNMDKFESKLSTYAQTDVENESVETKKTTTANVSSMNELKSKLTEDGLQKLRLMEEFGLIQISEDGKVDLSELQSIPLIGPSMKDIDVVCKFLNQPAMLPPMNMGGGNLLQSINPVDIQKIMQMVNSPALSGLGKLFK